jgi:nitrite reductase/ring-hydroxylating ferredoxin subunit
MSNPVDLCATEDVPEGAVMHVVDPSGASGFGLILTRRGGEVKAFRNQCPHAGRPLDWAPGRFLIDHGRLVCAAHGASFSLPEGDCVGGPCRGEGLGEVAVEVVGGRVCLRL